MNYTLPDVEKRLQKRYHQLVEEHAGHAHPTASGPRLLPKGNTPQAGAMAAWRFFDNPRITLPCLAQPLLQAGCAAAGLHCSDFALIDLDAVLSVRADGLGPGGRQALRQAPPALPQSSLGQDS